ncbi:MAG: sporulation protein YabP [Tenericutes bacterium]|nr:sporulation protein YabP [Mycoplasmatota bacterium]
MDKQENSISNYNHGISLLERKNLVITGVKKIENFDKEQFLLETVMGFIIVKGEDLELVKLDTLQGNVSIKGTVNALYYAEDINKKKEDSIFNRLFK